MGTEGVIQLISLIVLIFLSCFFSSAETALTTVNRVKMKTLEEDGNRRAARVNKILEQNSKMLSAILIGNNIVNISASALATTLAMQIHLLVGIATGLLTLIILIFGEIVPKTWAMVSAEKLSLAYSGVIYSLMTVLTPLIFLVDVISKGVMKLLRIDLSKRETMTEDELKTYVDVSHEDGVIETEEREMILNVFEFSDAVAKDIMIPRVNMVTVKVSEPYEEVLSTFRESMYTRLPVYEEDEEGQQDHFLGHINIKDFIFCQDPNNFEIRDYLREAIFTHEHKKTADLLEEMRKSTVSIAFVTNEYGDTVGMITLEDLLEEIVGEIRDEYDADEIELVQTVGERTFLVEGSMNLDDVNDALGTQIESEDYDSIGGIMIEQLDRLPEDGEEVVLEDGTRLKVCGMDQNRIEQVEIELPEPQEEEPEAAQVDAEEAETK